MFVNRLTSKIGAQIKEIDLIISIDINDIELIYKSLIKNKVIFFRVQIIISESLIKFAKNFRKIEQPHPVNPYVKNYKEIVY